MIEVIYDKNRESIEQNSQKTNGEKTNSGADIKLPKNIRQIGTPVGNKRIYIEDYVVTYLNYIARPGSTQARGAILLGEFRHSEIGDIIFICGAVDAQNLEFDMDESAFTQEAWTEIYDQVKEFFPDLTVVGWFLSRMGFSTAINDKIEKMHVENFPGKDKVLYITDSLESDDAFYMYERGQLVKQKGYFIYYTKNEAMQNYIIKQKGGIADEDNSEIKRKDEELIKSYREKNNRTQGTKANGVNLVYVASSFVVLAMLAMGVTVISNYDKMKEIEVSINRLELTAESIADDDVVDVIATEGGNKNSIASVSDAKDSTDAISVSEQTDNGIGEEYTEEPEKVSLYTDDDGDNASDVKLDDVTDTTEPIVSVMSDGEPTYYIIQYGESLSGIAYERYGSILYAEDIAKANNMDVDDRIYEGQKIILPDIAGSK